MTTSQSATGRPGLEDAGIQRILGRSAVYELLALGITYPTEASVKRLVDLATDLQGHDIVKTYGLAPRLAAIRESIEGVAVPELQLEHSRLFLGQVLCSPHETEYERDTFSKASQLADIAGFYNAWGLQTSESRRTMPDFVGTELEFLAMVTRREAYAALRGWANRRKVARASADAFMQSHLGRWVNAFAADLREVVADDPAGRFYAALARTLEQFVVMDVAAAGVAPAMLTLRVPRPEDDEPMVCMDDPAPPPEGDSLWMPDASDPNGDLPPFPSFEV